MFQWHCRRCHHEWDACDTKDCNWCGADAPRWLGVIRDVAFWRSLFRSAQAMPLPSHVHDVPPGGEA